MLFLENKITLINQYIKQNALSDNRFQNGYFVNTPAKTAAIQSVEGEGKLRYLPVVYNKLTREYNYIGLDDIYPVILYHKHIQTTYVDVDIDERKELNKMLLIVFGRLDYLNLEAETLAAMVVSGFPTVIKRADYINVPILLNQITLTDSLNDAETVFAREYRNTAYQLGPQHALMQFGYTIESTYNKKCFDICGCLTNSAGTPTITDADNPLSDLLN